MHMTTTPATGAELREQSRACYPDESGIVERGGVRAAAKARLTGADFPDLPGSSGGRAGITRPIGYCDMMITASDI